MLDPNGIVTWNHLSPVGINPGADGFPSALDAMDPGLTRTEGGVAMRTKLDIRDGRLQTITDQATRWRCGRAGADGRIRRLRVPLSRRRDRGGRPGRANAVLLSGSPTVISDERAQACGVRRRSRRSGLADARQTTTMDDWLFEHQQQLKPSLVQRRPRGQAWTRPVHPAVVRPHLSPEGAGGFHDRAAQRGQRRRRFSSTVSAMTGRDAPPARPSRRSTVAAGRSRHLAQVHSAAATWRWCR